MAVFEYHYRWNEIAKQGLEDSEDELEARDVELERFIRQFTCGTPEG